MGQARTLHLRTTRWAPFEGFNLSMASFGAVFAWIAVIIYASSNSIVTLLVDIGAANPVEDGRNALTYSNLLILGSLISLVPLALLYRRDITRKNARNLTRRNWSMLAVSAFLSSALTPGLFFYALEHTTVTNMVLIGRIEPPLFLLATWLFLKERLDPWAMMAGLVALAGAIIMIGMQTKSAFLQLGVGEIATIGATLSFIASTLVTRTGLRDVPLGIFVTFRTLLGTAIYFVLTSAIFGTTHYQDIFAPIALQWVWVYAIVVVVFGQCAWNLGLKYARAGDVSLATSFSPLAAIMIATLLLGEDPGPGFLPGGVIILLAIAIGQYGRRLTTKEPAGAKAPMRDTFDWQAPHWTTKPSCGGRPCTALDIAHSDHEEPEIVERTRRKERQMRKMLMPPSARLSSDRRSPTG